MKNPRIKPRARAFDLDAFPLDHALWFRIVAPKDAAPVSTNEVGVPAAICYRLHHLGRAYDGQVVKYLQPQGSYVISYMDVQLLISELEMVQKATKDPVVEHYLTPLMGLLRSSSANPKSSLQVVERDHVA